MKVQNIKSLLDHITKSRLLLDVIVQSIATLLDGSESTEQQLEQVQDWLLGCLVRKELLSLKLGEVSDHTDSHGRTDHRLDNLNDSFLHRTMSLKDYYLLWLIYFHVVWFKDLPTNLCYDFPYEFITRQTLFEVKWESSDAIPPLNSITQLRQMMEALIDMFQRLVSNTPDSVSNVNEVNCLIVILRNYSSFIDLLVHQHPNVAQMLSVDSKYLKDFLYTTTKRMPKVLQIWDLFAEYSMVLFPYFF
jgi:hypothetical protein